MLAYHDFRWLSRAPRCSRAVTLGWVKLAQWSFIILLGVASLLVAPLFIIFAEKHQSRWCLCYWSLARGFWCEDGHVRSKSGNKEDFTPKDACCPVYLRACLILYLLFWGSKRRCLWSTGGITVGVCCPVIPCSHLTQRHELFISLLHLENTTVSTGPSNRLQLWGEVYTCQFGVLDNQTRPRSPLPG